MNNDIEKLRNELKSKIDEIIDNYIDSNKANDILEIPEDNIYMEFNIGDENYIAFTEDSKDVEEFQMMFAKLEFIDGNRILRNIENAKEYESVVNEFNRRLLLVQNLNEVN